MVIFLNPGIPRSVSSKGFFFLRAEELEKTEALITARREEVLDWEERGKSDSEIELMMVYFALPRPKNCFHVLGFFGT